VRSLCAACSVIFYCCIHKTLMAERKRRRDDDLDLQITKDPSKLPHYVSDLESMKYMRMAVLAAAPALQLQAELTYAIATVDSAGVSAALARGARATAGDLETAIVRANQEVGLGPSTRLQQTKRILQLLLIEARALQYITPADFRKVLLRPILPHVHKELRQFIMSAWKRELESTMRNVFDSLSPELPEAITSKIVKTVDGRWPSL